MKHYEHVVIGFGKGGKTLAGALAKAGHSVALIERDPAMYGGTCINVACIPSKFLEDHARASAMMGGSFEEKAARYRQTILLFWPDGGLFYAQRAVFCPRSSRKIKQKAPAV